jgi:hypothetical protein
MSLWLIIDDVDDRWSLLSAGRREVLVLPGLLDTLCLLDIAAVR